MMVPTAPAEIEFFRGFVAERLGLSFEDGKLDFLADVLRKRMEETGCHGFSSYRRRMDSPSNERSEIEALAEQLTVSETYFFRYAEQLLAFTEVVIPSRVKARNCERRLRILSAGCASGEEPYSVAILVREKFPHLTPWDVEILGFDISPAMIGKALRGRYSHWSLRETPDELRFRYFHQEGRDLQLVDTVRRAVTFEQRNLAEEEPAFWRPEQFDVVFCRNVTMYLTLDVTRSVIARIARSLVPGGFLFLGHAETLRGVSQEFHLRHTHGTFYYQRREACETEAGTTREVPASDILFRDEPAFNSDTTNDTWYALIRKASERIATLTDRENAFAADRAQRVKADTTKTVWNRSLALELLQKERFREAKELVVGLPAEETADPDTRLLLAVLLANAGELSEAEKVCQQLLIADELNAGAHYLMALCREHAGDKDAAIRHDEAAAYLDASFAMPHLHLGLIARRSADSETARRELDRALPLLGREDPSRVLLFGGGFTREALVELCRRELRACGGGM